MSTRLTALRKELRSKEAALPFFAGDAEQIAELEQRIVEVREAIERLESYAPAMAGRIP